VGTDSPALRAWPGLARRQDIDVTKTKNDSQDKRTIRDIEIDWGPARDAVRDVVDWVLDITEDLSPDERTLDAVDCVRDFVHAGFDGEPAELYVGDLFTTISTLLASFEADVSLATALRVAIKASLPSVIHLPVTGSDLASNVTRWFSRGRYGARAA
jgi:hypothetical protein